MARSLRHALLLLSAVGVGVWIGGGFAQPGQPAIQLPLMESAHAQGVAQAAPASGSSIRALGRLDPAGGVIDVSPASVDRLVSWGEGIHVGAKVKAQQVLAVLQSRSAKELELAAAESQLANAKARREVELAYGDAAVAETNLTIEQAQLSSEQELAAQSARLAYLLEAKEQAKKDFELFSQNPVSQYQKDQQWLLFRRAEEEHRATADAVERMKAVREINLKLAEAKRTMAKAGKARLEQAIPLEPLRLQVELAKLQLALTEVSAPTDGVVLHLFASPGEAVAVGQPFLRMAQLDVMEVNAEIDEMDLWKVKPGDVARITSAAFPQDDSGKPLVLTGKVRSVAPLINRNTITSLNPAADVDLRVFEARIRLDDAQVQVGGRSISQHELAGRMISLQVDVEIAVGK